MLPPTKRAAVSLQLLRQLDRPQRGYQRGREQNDDFELHHWREESRADEGNKFTRFDQHRVRNPHFSVEDYIKHLKDDNWSIKETVKLFDL